MAHYLLAVLDGATQERLTALSELLTARGFPYTRYTPYHITLMYDDAEPSEETYARIERVCEATPTFEIAPGSIGLFGLAVLFISPAPSEALIALEKELCGELPVGWVPHITIRMGEPEYITAATPLLAQACDEPFTMRIERLELYESGDDYSTFVRSFPLRRSI